MAEKIVPIVGDRDKIFPGASVVLQGVIRGNKAVNGIIFRIHEPGVLMTDPDGNERPWNGVYPVIDAVIVDRKIEDAPANDQENPYPFGVSPSEGVITLVQKIPWGGDIENRVSFLKLPKALMETCPRYRVVHTLQAN